MALRLCASAKKIRNGISLFLLMLCFDLAASVDSTQYKALLIDGQKKFCSILDNNDCALSKNRISDMQFVVVVDPNENYSYGYTMAGSTAHPATADPLKDSLNAWIRSLYTQYHLELYMIFINTLDVEIKTPLPDSATTHDLFCTHLYDSLGNLSEMEALHESLSHGIVNGVISPQHRDCIILSTAEFQGAFHGTGKISKWKFSKLFKHTASERTFADLDEVFTDYYKRIQQDQLCSSTDAQTSVEAYVNDLRGSLHSLQLRALILQALHPDPLKLILGQMSYPQDYNDLTLEQRKHILSVFAGYSMLADYFGNIGEERYTIRTIISTPQNQIEGLLGVLSLPSYLNDNPDYLGTKGGAALIVVLMYRIDDSAWNEDNDYTKFVKAISDLMMSSDAVIANHLPENDEQWMRRKINWGGTTEGGLEDIGYQKYDVTLNSSGTLQIASHIVSSWEHVGSSSINSSGVHPYNVVWSDNGSFSLNPFDLVFFTNRSNVSMLESAGAHRGSIEAVPAIFLKYAADKQFNQSVTEAVTTTIYVAGTAVGVFATGGAAITAIEAADFALAAYAASQFVGVVGQIAADLIGNPTLRNLALAYNSIIGIWGVGELLANTSQLSSEILTRVEAGTIRKIPEGTANSFKEEFEAAQANLGELDEATKNKLERMEEYLGESVENTTHSSMYGPDYLATLTGFSDDIASIASRHGIDLQTFKTWEEMSAADLNSSQLATMNAIRAEIPALNANTVLQKCVPKSDISKYLSGEYTGVKGYVTTAADAKHLTTYDDVFYGIRLDYTQTKYSLADGECGLIRFRASNASEAYVPKSLANEGTVTDSPPFTGHGFTSGTSGRLGVPEWKMDTPFEILDGAELWKIKSNGEQILLAVYEGSLGKFISVQ